MMAFQLVILEKNLKTKAQKSNWRKIREKWLLSLTNSDSFQDIANHIAELDSYLTDSAQSKEWRKVRDEWKKKTLNIRSIEEVVWLLKEFEGSVGSKFKESSWEKVNQVGWKRALPFAVTFYNSPPKDDNIKIADILRESIAQGVELFNSGDIDLCAKLYQLSIEIVLNFSTPENKLILTKVLSDSESKLNPADRAWILR